MKLGCRFEVVALKGSDLCPVIAGAAVDGADPSCRRVD